MFCWGLGWVTRSCLKGARARKGRRHIVIFLKQEFFTLVTCRTFMYQLKYHHQNRDYHIFHCHHRKALITTTQASSSDLVKVVCQGLSWSWGSRELYRGRGQNICPLNDLRLADCFFTRRFLQSCVHNEEHLKLKFVKFIAFFDNNSDTDWYVMTIRDWHIFTWMEFHWVFSIHQVLTYNESKIDCQFEKLIYTDTHLLCASLCIAKHIYIIALHKASLGVILILRNWN